MPELQLLAELPPPPPGKTGWPWTEQSAPMPACMEDGQSWPKISIVTPSFNQAEFIEETIRSVLLQNYPNLEYIIIDGGSTDGSVEIIKKYEPWLSYWVSEPDNGHGSALNKGFSRASGSILAWINSDDKYLLWTFSIVAEIFTQHQDIHWITGMSGFWDCNGRLVGVETNYKNIYDFLLGRYRWIQQESVFFSKSIWTIAGGFINENYKLMVDGELWCRFFKLTNLWHVKTVLSGYRIHSSNRAAKFYSMCLCEMESAVGQLKLVSSKKQKIIFYKLQLIGKIHRRLSRIKIPIDYKRILLWYFRGYLDEACYNILYYHAQKKCWIKKYEKMDIIL